MCETKPAPVRSSPSLESSKALRSGEAGVPIKMRLKIVSASAVSGSVFSVSSQLTLTWDFRCPSASALMA